jgi:hypothetical protein
MKSTLKKVIRKIQLQVHKYKVKNKTKYFCIGRNKTGTTSLKQAFNDLGFIVGNQTVSEKLYDIYFFQDDFDKIISYCKTAEVFQDVPFSYFKTVPYVDKAYPNSKFILTIRDTPEQWYNSITKFHAKKFGKNGRIPNLEDLKNATYLRKGFMYNTIKAHGTNDQDPYNKEIMISHYNEHNRDVIDYFKNRPNDLIVINLSVEGAYQKFSEFIGVDCAIDSNFPWENKT